VDHQVQELARLGLEFQLLDAGSHDIPFTPSSRPVFRGQATGLHRCLGRGDVLPLEAELERHCRLKLNRLSARVPFRKRDATTRDDLD
jgi:hypothetical protein